MSDLTFSVLMPTYNGGKVLSETIKSILSQSYKNFELLIQDDNSTDDTISVIKSFKDKRILIFRNKKNLGYSGNLESLRKKAKGDIVYLMGQDDILANDALLNTYKAFKLSPNIGAVTRPYFWFDKDVNIPVRAKEQLNPHKDELVRITDSPDIVISVFKTLDQLSGLAFRSKFIDVPFHEDIFPCHVYPFASIMKKHPIVFLKDYNIAVRIASSQTRSVSSIYNKSPVESWIDMMNFVFHEDEFKEIRNILIKDFVARNYVGLVQIRNYSFYKYLVREIFNLIKYRWQNILYPSFWFFSLGCLIIPPSLLIPLVDWYKNTINSKFINKIRFEYTLVD